MIDFKQDKALWLAFALPVVMIVCIAASIYLPRLWAPEPQYGFVYASNGDGYTEYNVRVRDGKLERVPVDISEDDKVVISDPRLYLYNPRSNESHEITFDEAQALQLDDRKKSPDGFEAKVSFGSGGPFGGSSEGGAYLSGHMTSHKLDLRGIERVYDFQFVGWVTP